MAEREIIWVTVSTTSIREADKIGKAALKARLCACYGLIPKIKSVYYWPPRSNKRKKNQRGRLETSKGPLLVLETMERKYEGIVKLVKSLHSDKVPFIGQWEMENVSKEFYAWMKGELDK